MEDGSSKLEVLIMEDDVPLMETFESLKKMSKGKEKKEVSPRSPIIDDDSEEKSVADEEDDKIPPTSVKEDYDWNGFPEDPCRWEDPESEEELIRDSDRNEIDHGYRFVVRKRKRTITNPRRPQKTYIPRSSKRSNSVLHRKQHPLSALAKMALRRYNDIRGTNYEYIGLVKAYKGVVVGFIFWIRFKACLPAQPPINFQAIVIQGIPDRPKPGTTTRDVAVDIQYVYPLP